MRPMFLSLFLATSVFAAASVHQPFDSRLLDTTSASIDLPNVNADDILDGFRRFYDDVKEGANGSSMQESFVDRAKERFDSLTLMQKFMLAVGLFALVFCVLPCLCCCLIPRKLKCLLVLIAIGGCLGYFFVLK